MVTTLVSSRRHLISSLSYKKRFGLDISVWIVPPVLISNDSVHEQQHPDFNTCHQLLGLPASRRTSKLPFPPAWLEPVWISQRISNISDSITHLKQNRQIGTNWWCFALRSQHLGFLARQIVVVLEKDDRLPIRTGWTWSLWSTPYVAPILAAHLDPILAVGVDITRLCTIANKSIG